MAGASLVRLLHALHPGDQRPADWAVGHVSLDDPDGVAWLLRELRQAGATGQVARWPASRHPRQPRPPVSRGLPGARAACGGATGQVDTLASRAAAHASLDNPDGVACLLRALRRAGATSQVDTLLDRDPAADASLDHPDGVACLLRELREAGATSRLTPC